MELLFWSRDRRGGNGRGGLSLFSLSLPWRDRRKILFPSCNGEGREKGLREGCLEMDGQGGSAESWAHLLQSRLFSGGGQRSGEDQKKVIENS